MTVTFHFSLSDKEPTIPILLKDTEPCQGTQMDFVFHQDFSFRTLQEQDVLLLCLGLHQLRRLKIDDISIDIEDNERTRTVTVNGNRYVFDRIEHSFSIKDEKAIRERAAGYRKITPEQKIICYLPEKRSQTEWPVYCGLPTLITSKIPMAVDAPYELTTSREHILGNRWNDYVTQELNRVIVSVIIDKTKETGIEALRYLHVENDKLSLFSDDKLYCAEIMDALFTAPILPTCKADYCARPKDRTVYRLPSILKQLRQLGARLPLGNEHILADGGYTMFASVLDWLGCKELSIDQTYEIIGQTAAAFIQNEQFRAKLYKYLYDKAVESNRHFLEDKCAIIPVLARKGSEREYISLQESSEQLYTQKGAQASGADYWVLHEERMTQQQYICIFSRYISAMNESTARDRYIETLKRELLSVDGDSSYEEWDAIYHYLLTEYKKNKPQWDKWHEDISYKLQSHVIFLMQNDELRRGSILISPQSQDYYMSDLVHAVAVNDECKELAEFFGMRSIKDANYEDVSDYSEDLTCDDIESLKEYDCFANGVLLLNGFLDHGQIPESLIERYDLGILHAHTRANEEDDEVEHEFPVEHLHNVAILQSAIRKRWDNPERIVRQQVSRTIPFVHYGNGREEQYSNKLGRDMALRRYTPTAYVATI